MKKLISLSLSVMALAILSACGEDSSSAAGAGADNTMTRETRASLVEYPEENLFVQTTFRSEDVCVVYKREYWDEITDMYTVTIDSLRWQNMTRRPNVDSMFYEFHGDTLVTYDSYWTGDYINDVYVPVMRKETYGEMYVGGTPGVLYGTWRTLPCEYDSQSGMTTCEDTYWNGQVTFTKGVETNVDGKMAFVDGAVSTKIVYSFNRFKELRLTEDYMRSEFMYYLYLAFTSNHWDLYPTDIYPTDIMYKINQQKLDSVIAEHGISVQNSTKTSETFIFGGKSFDVHVSQASYEMYSRDVMLEIASEGVTCALYYHTSDMSPDLCRDENKESIDLESRTDVDGNTYYYAYSYLNSNNNEFRACLTSIKPARQIDDLLNPYNVALYKKSTKQSRESFDERREKQLRRLEKYAE